METTGHESDTGISTSTPSWMRVARGAAVTMVVWSIFLQITLGEVILPVLIIGLIFLAFVPFLSGERKRLGLALAVFTFVAVAGNAPIIIDDLLHPDSTPTFVLTLFSVVTALVVFTAGLGAFFRWPATLIRIATVAAGTVFVIGAVASVVAGSNASSDVAVAGDVLVAAENVEYAPDAVSLDSAGGGVFVENRDGVRHTFTIEELGVDLDIPALKSRRIDIDAPAGTYTFLCTVPGHENMKGTLTING